MSYTSKYTGQEIDTLLDKINFNGDSNCPIGTIIPYMGTKAPKGYLVCDGSELNIADYTKLATHFETHFGSKNHFGGDGTTTFAVPDLRNEFLRGYGDRSNEIGKHQDATNLPNIYTANNGKGLLVPLYNASSGITSQANNVDSQKNEADYGTDGSKYQISRFNGSLITDSNYGSVMQSYTSRPTNVAVLFCIKYTESNNNTNANENYSTEEQRIGTWIDGKPLYRKVYKFDITATSTRQTIVFDEGFGVDKRLKNIEGNVFSESIELNWKGSYRLGLFDWHNNANQFFMFLPNMENNDLVLSTQWSTTQDFTVEAIVDYTKITD